MNARPPLEAIVIGGSAGALDALSHLLPALPEKFPVPILIVIHVPPDKHSVLAELFRGRCALDVHEARDKEPIVPGCVYFAPPDYHLQVEPDRYVSLSYDEPRLYSRPSIDVLFESAADAYGPGLLGLVLSGGNSDGTEVLRAILAGDGEALIQTPSDAQTSAMPASALAAHPTAAVRPAAEMAEFLKARCAHGN